MYDDDSTTDEEDLAFPLKSSSNIFGSDSVDLSEKPPRNLVSRKSLEETSSPLVSSDRSLKLPVPSVPVPTQMMEIVSEAEKPFFTGTPRHGKVDIPLGSTGAYIPGCTVRWLREYQIDGIKFMYDLYRNRSGGILGDDMGLGKTVQVIGFLNALFKKTGAQSDWEKMRRIRRAGKRYPICMIICPGSLLHNWQSELDTWSWSHVHSYHGGNKKDVLAMAMSGNLEILMTTYTTYKLNMDKLNQVKWDVVIADECHTIKEARSGVTQAMNKLNCKVRIGLTGTAIQNNYDELWTLLNWANPGKVLTAAQWSNTISSVLKNGQKHGATNAELYQARVVAARLCQEVLPKYLLRRTKALIAHQLPKKIDKVVFCPLSQVQTTAYTNLMVIYLII